MVKIISAWQTSGRHPFVTLLLAVIAIVIASWWADRKFESHFRDDLASTLNAILDINHTAMDRWVMEHVRSAYFIANSADVKKIAEDLLEMPADRDVLLKAQAKLRKELAWLFEVAEYHGFFIVAPNQVNLASSVDINVGKTNLLVKQPEVLEQLWKGRTVISHPMFSDVDLDKGKPFMIVGIPIKNSEGEIIAALMLKLDPASELFPVLQAGRVSDTGESYLFNADGLMLSESRFTQQLYDIDLLRPGMSAVRNISITDPGVNLSYKNIKRKAEKNPPLTRMARSATQREHSMDLDGYRDYRGVPVVGAWMWDEELDLGMTVEQDVAEAYQPLYLFRFILYGFAVLAISLLTGLVLLSVRSARRMENSKARLQSLFDTLADGVVVIDSSGIIESVNPAIEKIFGYSADELKGKNVKRLMPSAQHGHHDDYVKRFVNTNETKAVGTNRDVMACKKDGQEFPVELGVNEMILGNERYFTGVIRDITQRKEAEEKLAFLGKEMSMMATVAQETDNGVLITNKEGCILWANKGFSRISEYDIEDVYGQQLEALLLDSDSDSDSDSDVAQNIVAALRDGKKASAEIINHTKSGNPYWVGLEISPVYDDDGELSEFIVLARDVTELKSLMEALLSAKIEAEEANRSKSSFLAAMSHEIRTPMNGVVGMVDVLQRTGLDQRQSGLMKTIRDSAFSLMGIIDDILDFSKIEAGRMELDEVPTNFYSLFEGAGETLLPLADQKQVELIQFCDPRIRALKLDPVRVRQVLFNLAGNAVKFAENEDGSGRVILRADLLEAEPDQNKARIRIQVEDNGIGMNEEVQKHLFQPFVQAEGSTTRRFGGTGLGLVISRRIVDMMDGSIEVQSEEGKGATFSVYLDLEVAQEYRSAFVPDLFGVTVLLHSTDKVVRPILTSYLEYAGATVISEPDIEVCERRLESDLARRSDLVVMLASSQADIDAAGLRDKFKWLSTDEASGVVVVSNHLSQDVLEQDENLFAIRMAALSCDHLIRTVGAALGRVHFYDDETGNERTVVERVAVTVDEVRAKGELILLAEDNETNVKVILHQLELLGCAAEVALNGKEALELWRKNNYSLVLTDCHMPEMDGYDLARAIRAEEVDGNHVPIVAITADALTGARAECLEVGMDDYLTKPTQVDVLSQKLSRWLPSLCLSAQENIESEDVSPANPDSEVVNISSLIEAIGTDDKSILVDFYKDFLGTLNKTVVEIEQAYNDGACEEVAELAHRLKSSASTTGAQQLAECCLDLERMGKSNDRNAIDEQMGLFVNQSVMVQEWLDSFITKWQNDCLGSAVL